jgi:hypothetical protein
VLFGEGHGRTSGSYCGRVKWFLSSVAPSALTPADTLARVPPKPVAAGSAETSSEAEPARIAAIPAAHLANQDVGTPVSEQRSQPASIVAQAPGDPSGSAVQALSWEDVAGATIGEQVKTVLAAVGLLAVILHALRWLAAEPAKN